MASETETPRWKKEKTRLESLSDEDRRANYFCNDDFIGLSDIPTWKEYFEQHEKSLTEKGIYNFFLNFMHTIKKNFGTLFLN